MQGLQASGWVTPTLMSFGGMHFREPVRGGLDVVGVASHDGITEDHTCK